MSEEIKQETQEVQPPQKRKKKKLTKLEKWFRFMRRCYFSLGRLLVPIKKLGHTEKFNDRSYVFVGNHLSVLDVVPAAIALDKPVHFMAKKEIANNRIGKWFANKCECILLNRDGTDVRAVMLAMKYLKNGESVCIFPEGTRNKTDEIFLPFKSGAATLSIKTKTPIIIMVQCKKMRIFRRSYIYYSEPFEFTEYYNKKLTEDDIAAADEKLKQKMLEFYYQLSETIKNKKNRKK